VVTVKPERVILTTELPGRTAAYLIAEVRPQVGGIIQKRLFTEGSEVKEGEVLYQIDPAVYEANYYSAKAALSRAEANLVPMRLKVGRYAELVKSNAVSQQEYDDASAVLKQAEADVEAGKAAVETARINLAYTKVTAPISGQTVEVISTDAEGRLILSDGLTYGLRYKPKAVIDLATLTGACVVALGDYVMGLFGNDEALVKRIEEASAKTGEKVWRMPLWDEYFDYIKSDVADFKNVGTRAGGAIIGAIFLSKFVEKTPWVHLDIAGPASISKDRPYIPKGGTGAGVRLLVQLLRDWNRNA